MNHPVIAGGIEDRTAPTSSGARASFCRIWVIVDQCPAASLYEKQNEEEVEGWRPRYLLGVLATTQRDSALVRTYLEDHVTVNLERR